jgi:hypothetical protein
MTITEVSPACLRDLTDEQLLELSRESEAGMAAAMREAGRQDRNAAFCRRMTAERDALRSDWHDAAFAQYLAASDVCRGHLVAESSAVTDDWQLWSGSEAWARKNATEELREFWDANPRLTVTQYAAQVTEGRRIQRDERDSERMSDDGLADHEFAGVRPGSSADCESAPAHPGSSGNPFSAAAPGRCAQHQRASGGGTARAGSDVRGLVTYAARHRRGPNPFA